MTQPLGDFPPMIDGVPLSPVHYSPDYGVHADLGFAPDKMHIPFEGQTTLQTFGVGGRPGWENDRNLADMGGSFRPTVNHGLLDRD